MRMVRHGSSRFYLLTPPFLSRQLIYDSANRKFFKVKIRDTVDWYVIGQIFKNNDYGFEKLSRGAELIEYYKKLVEARQIPLIIDCGANSGMATKFFRETFPGAYIVAVEPDEENLELAIENNSPNEARFILAGVGNHDGQGAIIDPQEGNWAFRTVEDPNGPLEIISINKILAQQQPKPVMPFIIKIDIEGFEANLFEANTQWIEKFPVLIIELHDYMLPKSASSRSFLTEISKLDRDFILCGENVFSISNSI